MAANGRAEEVLLFGSRAEGRARPDSDADFLVILEGRPTSQQRAELRIEVEQFNKTSGIQVQLFDRTGAELCEQLRRNLPPHTASNAMEQAIVLLPPDRKISRYAEFAALWRRANRTKGWLTEARSRLDQAKTNQGADRRQQSIAAAQDALNFALIALLISVGGDWAHSRNPLETLQQVAELNRPTAELFLRGQESRIMALLALSSDDAASADALIDVVSGAADVVDSVGLLVQDVINPSVPCPAGGKPNGNRALRKA